MADAVSEQTDVNSQTAVADSSPVVAQPDAANTPTVENTGAPKVENKVPQTRFNEVIQERNSEREARERLENRIRELELGRSEGGFKRESVADLEVKRLVKELDMEEAAARSIVQTYQNLDQARSQEQEASKRRNDALAWASQKEQSDPVYKDIEPELDRSYGSLSPKMKYDIAQNPELLEMFYESVKAKHLGSKSKDSYSKGVEDALKNKGLKQAVSSVSGTSSSVGQTALSRESIRKMIQTDIKQYVKRQAEINEAIKNGTLK